jgi:AcrR family transcriptional regulator
MPPRRTRREVTEQIRAALLQAAAAEFARVGYTAARLEGIAQRAGVTKGAIYSNFASKADLYRQAVIDQAGVFAQGEVDTAALLDEGLTLDQRLRGFGQAALATFRAQRALGEESAVITAEEQLRAMRDPQTRALVKSVDKTAVQGLTAVLREAATANGVRYTVPPAALAEGILSLIRGAGERSADLGTDRAARALPDLLPALVRGAIQTTNPPSSNAP